MSKFIIGKVVIKSREALVAALKRQGFDTVEVHEEPQHLFGFRGDQRPQKANVIVRHQTFNNISNDFGFAEIDGTWEAIISNYDSNPRGGYLDRRANTKGLGLVTRTAALALVEHTISVYEDQNYHVTESEIDGKITLSVTGFAGGW